MDADPAILAEFVETRVARACGVLPLTFGAVSFPLTFPEQRRIVVGVELPGLRSSPVTLENDTNSAANTEWAAQFIIIFIHL